MCAAVIHPTASGITFGAPDYTGLLVQNCSIKKSSGKKEIADHEGEFAAIVYFQKKNSVQVDGYALTTQDLGIGISQAPLAALTIGGQTSTGLCFLDSVDASASNSDATKLSISGSAYDAITTS